MFSSTCKLASRLNRLELKLSESEKEMIRTCGQESLGSFLVLVHLDLSLHGRWLQEGVRTIV